MQQLKNIIFDFGGVLVDWNPRYLYSTVFETTDEMNYFLENICTPEWNLQQDKGRSLAVATAEKQQEFPQYKEQIGLFYGRWGEMLGGTIAENIRLIEPLKKNYSVYGLTNWSAETLPIAMELYSFFVEMEGIVVSGEEKMVKPDAEIYHVLLDRYGLKAEESLFIDDNAANIETSRQLGFKTIHFTPEVDLEKELKEMGVLLF